MQFSQRSSRWSAKANDLFEVAVGYFLETVDPLGLKLFRTSFGILLGGHFVYELLSGAAYQKFIIPAFHFKYPGFSFVGVPPASLLPYFMCVLIGSLLCMAFGKFSRLASLVAFLLTLWLLLADMAYFLNQDYLHCLLCFLCFLTCHQRKRKGGVPRWHVSIFQFQFLVVYLFGAWSKLNWDWLAGWPCRMFSTSDRSGYFSLAACYGSLMFDLVNGPLLFIPRTKSCAIWTSLFFHFCQWFTFGGVASLINIFSLLLFVDQRLLAYEVNAGSAGLFGTHKFEPESSKHKRARPTSVVRLCFKFPSMVVAGGFVIFQILFPLRYLLWGTDVAWTEEGRLFSWQGISRHKLSRGQYLCVDEISSRRIDPALFLSRKQLRKMMGNPRMIRSFAFYLESNVVKRFGLKHPSIYGLFEASLNGRPFASLIDSDVNLLTGQDGGIFSLPSYVSRASVALPKQEWAFPSTMAGSSTLELCGLLLLVFCFWRFLLTRLSRDVAKRV